MLSTEEEEDGDGDGERANEDAAPGRLLEEGGGSDSQEDDDDDDDVTEEDERGPSDEGDDNDSYDDDGKKTTCVESRRASLRCRCVYMYGYARERGWGELMDSIPAMLLSTLVYVDLGRSKSKEAVPCRSVLTLSSTSPVVVVSSFFLTTLKP